MTNRKKIYIVVLYLRVITLMVKHGFARKTHIQMCITDDHEYGHIMVDHPSSHFKLTR